MVSVLAQQIQVWNLDSIPTVIGAGLGAVALCILIGCASIARAIREARSRG